MVCSNRRVRSHESRTEQWYSAVHCSAEGWVGGYYYSHYIKYRFNMNLILIQTLHPLLISCLRSTIHFRQKLQVSLGYLIAHQFVLRIHPLSGVLHMNHVLAVVQTRTTDSTTTPKYNT